MTDGARHDGREGTGTDGAGAGPAFPVLNWFELEWKEYPGSRGIYSGPYAELGVPLGARKLGYHAEILPPGTALCPYHVHLVNEEMFLVMGGQMSVRLDGAEYDLQSGDVVAVPPGPDGAHQFLNRTGRPAHLFAASTKVPRDVIDYPDSGKRLYAVDNLQEDEKRASVMIKEGRAVEYLEGENSEALPPRASPAEAPAGAGCHSRIVNVNEIPWEPFGEGGFGGEWKRVGKAVGARLLGYSLYRLPPGRRSWPFHFHHVNEEFFYVRSGYGRLRTRDGTRELRPGDAFACLPGPAGAHALLNTGDAPLEYFALSSMEEPEVAEYPDSGKLCVWVGSAPGGDEEARAVVLAFRAGDAVDYMEGER